MARRRQRIRRRTPDSTALVPLIPSPTSTVPPIESARKIRRLQRREKKAMSDKVVAIFVANFMAGMSAARAMRAIRPELTYRSAAVRASELLRTERARNEIARQRDRIDLHLDRLIAEAGFVAYSDLRQFMSWDENGITKLIASDEIGPEGAAIAQFEQIEETVEIPLSGGRVMQRTTKRFKIKTHPKIEAIKFLGRVHGITKEDTDESNVAEVLASLTKAIMKKWGTRDIAAPGKRTAETAKPVRIEATTTTEAVVPPSRNGDEPA